MFDIIILILITWLFIENKSLQKLDMPITSYKQLKNMSLVNK